jgi:twitching motility protein PilT
MKRIDTFLELATQQGGSDLHLVSGETPRIRIHGQLQPVRFRELSPEDVETMIGECMDERVRAHLTAHASVDFAYDAESAGRFRVNVYRHARGTAAVLHAIPTQVPNLEALDLPAAVKAAPSFPKGLFLVTGPTGAGKSTTLAAIIDSINRTRSAHIITLEDPIEFVHPCKKGVVSQREIGRDVPDFQEGLRSALREDPNVILVGEMRDLETISLALTAAETGVQVFGTLHTNGAVRAVDRIINVFPTRRQDQVRTNLSECLRMVVSQQLVRKVDGTGRVAAVEVLIGTHAVSSMIRANNSHKLASVIQAGGRMGMQGLDAVLADLVRRNVITGEEAHEHAVDRTQFERFVVPEAA